MQPVQDYLETLNSDDKAAIKRIYDIAKKLVPEAEEGMSYGMAALKYKGKGLVSAVVFKNHMSYFPYSGTIPGQISEELKGFEFSKGTIYFSLDHQLSDKAIEAAVVARKEMIDQKTKI